MSMIYYIYYLSLSSKQNDNKISTLLNSIEIEIFSAEIETHLNIY